jgi:hypothetical protein
MVQMFLKPMLKALFIPIILSDKRFLPDWELDTLRGEWHRSLNTKDWCSKRALC